MRTMTTYEVAARELGVSRRTLQRWVAEGEVTAIESHGGGLMMIDLSMARRVKRRKALRNPALQARARRLRSEIEAATGEKPWTVKQT